MFLIPNLVLIAVSAYIIVRSVQAYRAFREARLGLFAVGQLIFAFSLVIEGLAGAVAVPRLLRPLEPVFLMSYQIMAAGLLLVAISVTPAGLFAVFVPIRIGLFVAVNAALSAYIGAVLLYRYVERRTNPWPAVAYLLFSASLALMHIYGLALLLRVLAAVFLAIGVTYAEAEKK
ncbi:MAG: hypothetical protein QXP98_07515 [Thermoproteus sp.]